MAPNELKREATRLARRMIKGAGHLEQAVSRHATQPHWNLMVVKNRYRRPVETIATDLVEEMCRHSWLMKKSGNLAVVGNGASILLGECRDIARSSLTTGNANQTVANRSLTDASGRQFWVQINDAECPLNWLMHRRDAKGDAYLSAVQFAAAELLRQDYTLANMEHRVTFQWSDHPDARDLKRRAPADGTFFHSERTVAARRRLQRALDAIGPDMADIAVQICCLSRGIEAAERALGYARRTGRPALLKALDRLANHYRLQHHAGKSSGRRPSDFLDPADHRSQSV